ncbi:MAG: histidine phosphatase family protein [Eubacteriales bacterium]|nr:histidine phosphatase family protein [Eubacteriales bacterium]
MTVVYFVRHAKPNLANHDDASRELSEQGLADRALVTAFLQDKNIDAVLSSPYRRAVDTVRDFADRHGHRIVVVPDFRERKVDSGWIDDFADFTRRQWQDFHYKLAAGESLAQVQARNIAALRRVLHTYRNQNVVIGSHGTAMSTIIRYYDDTFDHACFMRIQALMPWIVRFTFDGDTLERIQAFDVLAGQT